MGYENIHPPISKGERIGYTTKFRCRFCRFPVDANKKSVSRSENVTDGNIITTDGSEATSVIAGSGCPNCGSLNWSTRVHNGLIIRPEDRIGVSGNNRYRNRRGRF